MKVKSIFGIVASVLLIALLPACKGKNGQMSLDGDCMVKRIVLDSLYVGEVDLASREIVVWIPEVYDNKEHMKVTELTLSEGATADLKVGDYINMQSTQKLRVLNGNVSMDWSLYTENELAEILTFFADGYKGMVDSRKREIRLFVPATANIRAMVTEITPTRRAEVFPKSGVATNFSDSVVYTITNGKTKHQYTVFVTQIDKPKALYVGLASTMTELPIEEYTACLWMMTHIDQSLYASWDDIRGEKVDMSECKVIWWHYHQGFEVSRGNFEENAAAAVNAAPQLQTFLDNGGGLLLSRFATHLPTYLTINGEKITRGPNNCWPGAPEYDPEIAADPWHWRTDCVDHPLYKDVADASNEHIFTCDAGYNITNTTAQWKLAVDWSQYQTPEAFCNEQHATILGYGQKDDGSMDAVTVWEYPSNGTQGGIICIGSGAYDWFALDENYSGYHKNVEIMTTNAFNYLSK